MSAVPISASYVKQQLSQRKLEKKMETINNLELAENGNKQGVIVQQRRPFYINYLSTLQSMVQSSAETCKQHRNGKTSV